MEHVIWNKCQTPLEKLELDKYPSEIQEQFWDFLNNVPFIRWMVSPDRPLISELPRDEHGRAIIDITKPPILEGSDYFRQAALSWEANNHKYINLKPNNNPNSEFGKYIREERRRGWDGYLNPDSGMWITGDHYWLMNYCPIHMVVKRDDGLEMRATRHSKFWDGQFLMAHYVLQARQHKHHASYLASRGKGKTSFGAATLAKRFIIGESAENKESVQCMVTAADRTKLIGTNQILDVFIDNIDFCAKYTQFASRRLKSSKQELEWEMGYKKSGSDVAYGSQNSVSGIISGVNQDKLNGSRGVLYLVEEAGIFKDLLSMYNMIRPSVEQGSSVFGEVLMYGTAGDDMSDFTAFQEIFYSPEGYNMEALDNVFDKEGQGRKKCCMFYPAYLNYDDSCIDENGNSDVTKALLMLLNDRYKVKYGSTDINTITKRISQYPITPQEAIIRSRGNMFPVTELNARLNEIDNNPNEYDDVYVGEFVQKDGKIDFVPTGDIPIRDFPTKDNKVAGAIEIYSMPQKNSNGEIPNGRYIAGNDPYDNDVAESMSLGSFIMLDTWTDSIVMEYTGRPMYAEDFYEICRKACLFYNAKVLYEQNKKGMFSYFSQKNCVHLLADTPEYLLDKQLIKGIGYGNAHPYWQKVYTPTGIKQWGDIKVGDILFAPDGTTTKVIDIPFDEKTEIYKLTLKDGRVVYSSSGHLWNVIDYNGLSKVLSVKQMLEKGLVRERSNGYKECKYYIPQNSGVSYKEQNLPLDPYFLGLMLGDGCFTRSKFHKACFASLVEDLEFYKTQVQYACKTVDDRHHWWDVPGIGKILDSLDLLDKKSHTKFVPNIYKYNTKENRLSLLQGLLDTDGYIVPVSENKSEDKSGIPAYTTVSEKLAEDVIEIARSLGISCTKKESSNAYGSLYNVYFFTELKLFRLPRKKSRQRLTKKRAFKTGIINIEKTDIAQAKCVTVDREDGLYLIGEYVTTHNCRKGVTTTVPIKNFGFGLIRDWLLKPTTRLIKNDATGEVEEITVSNLYNIRNRALLKELILYHPQINVDRIMALCMLMIYREEMMVLLQGDLKRSEQQETGMAADDYWNRNYPGKKTGAVNSYF